MESRSRAFYAFPRAQTAAHSYNTVSVEVFATPLLRCQLVDLCSSAALPHSPSIHVGSLPRRGTTGGLFPGISAM